jgi:hypothetical protein
VTLTEEETAAVEPRRRADSWAEEFPWVFEQRYWLLSGALALCMLSYLLKFQWPGSVDIWEHAAAAREFAARPFNPRHPLLPVDRPHQFFSPYLWAVGVFSRLTGISVTTALMASAVFNLVLLLVTFRLFVRRVTSAPHVDFYALLFVLFLWGPGAWFFSGFLHFDVIANVLSYPSTFAKGLVFLSLWAHVNYLERDDPKWLLPTLVITSVVLLTHPVDALFLGIGALSLSLALPGTRERQAVLTLLTLAAAFLLALLWPFLPLYDLLFGDATAGYRRSIAAADRDMYVSILPRLGLALIVLPFALRRLPSWRSEPLALMFFGTLAAYSYGYYTHNWSYGRLISSVQIIGAIILAEDRARASQAAAALGEAGRPLLRWVQMTTAAIVILGMYFMRNGFSVLPDSVVGDMRYEWVHSYVDRVDISDFDFIAKHRHTYPVVISDLYTSLEIPTFGPKVIAFARTQAFVDTAERGTDLGRFYDPTTTADARRQIAAKYGATLLVVPVTDLTNDPTKFKPLVDLGREVSRNKRFVFVDLRPS